MTITTITMFVFDVVVAVLLADAVTGVLHYIEDHHSDIVVMIFGQWGLENIVKPNRLHHDDPMAITRGSYWDRVRISVFLAIPVALASICWSSLLFFLFALMASQANQIHCYAHVIPAKRPALVVLLQRVGIMQDMRHHSRHHRAPYECRFCVMTPWVNRGVEKMARFRRR